MHSDHYAIVIGLTCYPKLGDPPANLKGPENDAQAMKEWLIADDGGGLPPENVKMICSKNFDAPPNAAPTRDDIEQAFLWLDGIADDNQQQGKRRAVGARLYVYAAGHGFSPHQRQACLLAGNAAERQFSANVFCSAWVDWMQDAGYFQEFVLWMDCCMDRSVLTQPTPPPLTAIGGSAAPGPSFIAFAAPRPLKAVEKPIAEDEGKWHGVFTWNLLQGLRGAAANAFGIVTGRSLADWLRQAQLGWLDAADRRSPDIAKVPAIIDDNDALVFARGVTPQSFDVRLRFPETLAGKTARLWYGSPPKPGKTFRITKSGVPLKLRPGLYLAEAPAGGLRQGFAVTRSCELVVSETGDAPAKATGLFHLNVDYSQKATAGIQLVGDGFRPVDWGLSVLQSRLPFGLYQMRISIGRQIEEKVVLLDADWPKAGGVVTNATTEMLPALPKLTLAAPLPDTRTTSELLQKVAGAVQDRPDVIAGAGAELMVMARGFSGSGEMKRDARPWEGVAVLDSSGKTVARLDTAGRHPDADSPLAVCTFSLAPGFYTLRYRLEDGTPIEQSLILPPGGWRMEVYLLYRLDATGVARRPRMSLLMRRLGTPWGTVEDTRLEEARIALADERPVMSKTLIDLLLFKSDNPLEGMIGGHLLVMEQRHGFRNRLDLLNSVIPNLRGLVGSGHPDVEALSLACPDPKLRTSQPIAGAPLFERSWRMIVEASRANASLVSEALWQQVHAVVALPPYFIWANDAAAKEEFRKELAETIFMQRSAKRPSTTAPPVQASVSPLAFAPATGGETLIGSPFRSAQIAQVAGMTLPLRVQESMAVLGSDEQEDRTVSEASVDPQLAAKRAQELELPPVALDALRQEWGRTLQ